MERPLHTLVHAPTHGGLLTLSVGMRLGKPGVGVGDIPCFLYRKAGHPAGVPGSI